MKLGEIVHDSIIENKEKTKSYWEQLMLAANSPSSSPDIKQSNSQSPSSQMNHQAMNNLRLTDTEPTGGPKIVETVTKRNLQQKNEINSKTVNNNIKRGSVVEREIQMQKEREAAFAQEREEALQKANKSVNSEIRVPNDQEETLNFSIPTTDDGNFSEYGSEEKDENSLDESSSDKETPIEREIRLSKEREEELRREKQLSPSSSAPKTRSKSLTCELLSAQPSPEQSKPSQHTLPLNRGCVRKVVSQKVNYSIAHSKSANNLTEKVSESPKITVINNLQTNSHVSPTNATPSAKGAVPKLFSRNPNQKGLMKRFIASRGKLNSTFTFSSSPVMTAANGKNNADGLVHLSPSKIQQFNSYIKREKDTSLIGARPGYVSAEDKIQVELQEMRKREQELKEQRARSFIQSQPDLLSLLAEEDEEEKHQIIPLKLRSALSNPNLIDIDENAKTPTNETKPPIKRSALIEVWESMIQKK